MYVLLTEVQVSSTQGLRRSSPGHQGPLHSEKKMYVSKERQGVLRELTGSLN
jgi:hypothetical protein